MKKLYKILLPFLVINASVLTSCKNSKKDTRIQLSFGDVHATSTKEIDITELADAVNTKENFILVVNSTTCSCWTTFRSSLESYISKTKVLCYQITFNNIKDAAVDYGLTKISSGSTTFAIFKNGVIEKTICTDTDDDIMYNSEKFTKFMEENVILPKCFFIGKDDYHTIVDSKKNAVIYFERNACGDCKAINPGILRTYVENHNDMNNIYVLDCQQYWRSSNDAEYQTYVDTKNELGMSSTSNSVFGYSGGVFPFFSFIENGSFASGAVVYNDTVTKQDDKYIVADSYYTEDRQKNLPYNAPVVQGKELTSDDVNEMKFGEITYCIWKQESADKVYGDILTSFLDHALPKANYNF